MDFMSLRGDMTRGCSSGCEHFNPLNSVHGGPHSNVRHAGDLGNIKSNGKIAKGSVTVKNLSYPKSRFSIIGRMIVLHKDLMILDLKQYQSLLKQEMLENESHVL